MKARRLISSTLAIALLFSALSVTGCSQDEKGETSEAPTESKSEVLEDYKDLEGESVRYSEEGSYHTRMFFSGKSIKKEDVKVKYSFFSEEEYNEALKKDSNVDIDSFYQIKDAEVTEVRLNDSQDNLELFFKDNDAKRNRTDSYAVIFESRKEVSGIQVLFDDFKLSVSPESVRSSDNLFKLNVHNTNGSFKKNINKNLVTLSGGFMGFTIEGISNNDKDLVLQLSGNPTYNKNASIYPDGVITISSDAVVDAGSDMRVSVDIICDHLSFDYKGVNYHDGLFTIPLKAEDMAEIANLEPADIKFSDETIKASSVIHDDDEAYIVIDMGNMTRAEAFTTLDSQMVIIDGTELYIDLAEADFYPVVDFIEENDTKFNMTFELYANNGEFARSVDKSMISFTNELSGAEINSVKRTGNSVIEVNVTIDRNNMTIDDYKYNGGITLSEGTLLNRWNTKAKSVSYDKEFNAETGGKFAGLATIAAVIEVGSQIASLVSLGLSIAQMSQANDAQKELLEAIEGNRKFVEEKFAELSVRLDNVEKNQHYYPLQNFKNKLSTLEKTVKNIKETIRYAQDQFASEEKIKGQRPKELDPKNATVDEIQNWQNYWRRFYTADGNKLGFFNKKLAESKEARYIQFPNLMSKAEEQLDDIYSMLKTGIYSLDNLYQFVYNTNVQAAGIKYPFLANALTIMSGAHNLKLFYYGYFNTYTGSEEELAEYEKAVKLINEQEAVYKALMDYKMPNDTHDANNKIYFYSLEIELKNYSLRYLKNASQKYPSIHGFSYEQVIRFTSRFHGRTLKQEFENIGIPIKFNECSGIITSFDHTNKGKLDNCYHWYRQIFKVIDWGGKSHYERHLKSYRNGTIEVHHNYIFFQ